MRKAAKQLTILEYRQRSGRGGPRKNAGRKPSKRPAHYHVRRLTSPRQVRNALRYVLLNLRKHRFQRTGRAGAATIDDASSGRWFEGWKTGAVEAGDERPREVAQPRSWLLKAGWRRHGPIALAEIPGVAL
jgi:hypothetical protein